MYVRHRDGLNMSQPVFWHCYLNSGLWLSSRPCNLSVNKQAMDGWTLTSFLQDCCLHLSTILHFGFCLFDHAWIWPVCCFFPINFLPPVTRSLYPISAGERIESDFFAQLCRTWILARNSGTTSWSRSHPELQMIKEASLIPNMFKHCWTWCLLQKIDRFLLFINFWSCLQMTLWSVVRVGSS